MKKIICFLIITLLAYSCDNKIDAGDINSNSENIADITTPVITLIGDATMNVLSFGAYTAPSTYTEPGATATDDIDGTIEVVITGTVNIAVPDDYTITYTATDAAENVATETRIVKVIDVVEPHLTNPTSSLGSVQVSLDLPSDYKRGVYIWVEDSEGNYVDTIEQYLGFATHLPREPYEPIYHFSGRQSGAAGGRFSNDQCYAWQAAAGETGDSTAWTNLVNDGIPFEDEDGDNFIDSYPESEVIDGYTSATLSIAAHTYYSVEWDCKDVNGDPVPSGLYTIQVELTYDTGFGTTGAESSRSSGEVIIWSANDTADLTILQTGIDRINSASADFTAN